MFENKVAVVTGGAKGIGRQFLRFANNRYRMAKIIQRFHGIHINADTALTQQFHQFRVAPAALVPRHVEGDHTLTAEFFQCRINRRFLLTFPVQDHPSFL